MRKQRILIYAAAFAVLAGCSMQDTPVQSQETSQAPSAAETDEGWLPQGIPQMKAEEKPNEGLKKAIIDYYEIPEEEWAETRYYYNYVDLDQDGSDEIFAVVSGMYTSGSGGDSALWCEEKDGTMNIRQAFTLVNTPVLVTEEECDLVMERQGGGAGKEIVRLVFEDGVYTNVSDADPVKAPDELRGTAIICNDRAADMENGSYLTLAD